MRSQLAALFLGLLLAVAPAGALGFVVAEARQPEPTFEAYVERAGLDEISTAKTHMYVVDAGPFEGAVVPAEQALGDPKRPKGHFEAVSCSQHQDAPAESSNWGELVHRCIAVRVTQAEAKRAVKESAPRVGTGVPAEVA